MKVSILGLIKKDKNDRFARALMKYRRDKEKKKDGENEYGFKHNKSNKIMNMSKELEKSYNKQRIASEQNERDTPIIEESHDFENNNPQNDIVTLKSNKKKKALKKFED